jgi:hypothetical protein
MRRNMPDPVPVILLSRLVIDRKEQKTGLGTHMLRDAITRCVQAADRIGVRAMLVHPLHLMLLIKDAHALVGD